MAAAWVTSKSWTSLFAAPASTTNAPSKVNPIVFTERARTVSKSSTTSSKTVWTSKTRLRARGIVYELEPIPIDPTIDPDWDLCFNCWKPGHSHKECTYPKYFDYCRNCGRRGVNWTTCPRCAKGYINYQRWRVENNRPEYRDRHERPVVSKKGVENINEDNKVSLGMFIPLDESKAKEIQSPTSVPVHTYFPESASGSIQKDLQVDKSFPAINNTKKTVLSPPTQNSVGYTIGFNQSKSNSLGDSLVSSEEGDFNEDEDLDEIIFDDEETNLPEQSMSSTTQDFISLIELVKHLSIETQNKVVEDFLQQRRVLMKMK